MAPNVHQPLLSLLAKFHLLTCMDRLNREVSAHPDQLFVEYVLAGIHDGFHLGFNPAAVSLKSARQNMQSARLQPSVIDDYLQNEIAKGQVAGPFYTSPFSLQLVISNIPAKWFLQVAPFFIA